MKLRYCVNLENCFREGVNCNTRVQILEIDPATIPAETRRLLADHLERGLHNGEDVMDVYCFAVSEAHVEDGKLHVPLGEGGCWDPDCGHLLTARLPGFEHLLEAIKQEEDALAEHVRENQMQFTGRFVLKGLP